MVERPLSSTTDHRRCCNERGYLGLYDADNLFNRLKEAETELLRFISGRIHGHQCVGLGMCFDVGRRMRFHTVVIKRFIHPLLWYRVHATCCKQRLVLSVAAAPPYAPNLHALTRANTTHIVMYARLLISLNGIQI